MMEVDIRVMCLKIEEGPCAKEGNKCSTRRWKGKGWVFSRASQREGGLALKRGHVNGGQMKLILNFWTSETKKINVSF